MDNSELKSAVLDQLSPGKHKAISGQLLCQRLGLRDTRPARLAMIDLIIDNGLPVVFSSRGYYIAEIPEEVEASLLTLHNYIVNLSRHYKYLKLAGRKVFSGQLGLNLK